MQILISLMFIVRIAVAARSDSVFGEKKSELKSV